MLLRYALPVGKHNGTHCAALDVLLACCCASHLFQRCLTPKQHVALVFVARQQVPDCHHRLAAHSPEIQSELQRSAQGMPCVFLCVRECAALAA